MDNPLARDEDVMTARQAKRMAPRRAQIPQTAGNPQGLGAPERIPEPAAETILDVCLQRLIVAPFEESVPAKLGRALAAFDAAHKRRI